MGNTEPVSKKGDQASENITKILFIFFFATWEFLKRRKKTMVTQHMKSKKG